MAAEHWFRWHHGTVTDPKFRVIANRASRAMSRNVTVGHVLAVWAAMLECASQANPRGQLVGWSDEDAAAGLGMDEEEVAAIYAAMQDKTLDGERLSGWNRRQIKAEDATAADRKRRQREREEAEKALADARDNAKCHGASRNVPVETETETETEQKKQARSSAAPSDAPAADDVGAKRQQQAHRLATVTAEAIAAFNASPLVKPNGGLLATVSITVGREKRQQQVARCRRLASQICAESYGGPAITAAFWSDYWAEVAADEFLSGRRKGGNGHENWLPDFEFLTREAQMLKVYDRASSESAA